MEKGDFLKYFILVIVWVGLAGILVVLRGSPTGFAVFGDSGQGDFDLGDYNNVEWNGSAIVLSENNLTGTYTSQIFDATNDAVWNNISWVGGVPDVEFLYGVDGGGDVYRSADSGLNWSLSKEDYGRNSDTQEMFSDSVYIYIISTLNREVWRSEDSGVTWVVINDSFADSGLLIAESDSNGNLYIGDASGDVYLSVDDGVSWTLKGDFNAGQSDNAKGMGIDSSGNIYVVDGSKGVFYSSNSGVDWTQKTDDYGGGGAGVDDLEVDSSGNLYILDNSDVWKSVNEGVDWTKINDDFSPYSNDGCKMLIDSNNDFYIADCSGRVFDSDDSGVNWNELGDLNAGAGNDILGLTDFSQTSNLSNMTFQVINCSSSDCSDGTWQTVDLNNINLQGRYFQYKIDFTSPDSSVSPYLNSIEINYDLVNTAPTISLVSPQDGDAYGDNESINLNFSVSDADSNLDSCWYNIANQSNSVIIIENTTIGTGGDCQNTTFDIPYDGYYVVSIYANDSLGEEVSDSANFSVAVGAPTIVLTSPINTYSSSFDVTFRYTSTDFDLDSCELWGDFTGSFVLNQTEYLGPGGSGIENTFSLTLLDGTYLWNIRCNDSVGNSAINGNKTFYIDSINPRLTISEPSGEKTSRTEVLLTFSVSDASPIDCWYNVMQGASEEIANTTIASCNDTIFDVSSDADFVFNLYVNDSAGNSNSTSSSFSVDTSSIPVVPDVGGGSGGGGGGGGGSAIVTDKIRLESSLIDNLVVYQGDQKTLSLSVKNLGIVFLNNCKLVVSGDLESWIYSNQIEGIAPGQNVNFIFNMNVPEEINSGDYIGELKISCNEGNYSQEIKASIPGLRGITINSINHEKDNLIIDYVFDNSNFIGENINIEIWLEDETGFEINRINDVFSINVDNLIERNINIELPEDLAGIYYIYFAVSSDLDDFVKQSIVLGESSITGLAIFFGSRGKIISYFVFVIVIMVGLYFVLKRHRKKFKREKKHNHWLVRKPKA